MRVDAITLPLCLITLGSAACGCESKGSAPTEPVAQKPTSAATDRSAPETRPEPVARPAASPDGAIARPAPSAPPPDAVLTRPGRVKY